MLGSAYDVLRNRLAIMRGPSERHTYACCIFQLSGPVYLELPVDKPFSLGKLMARDQIKFSLILTDLLCDL